MNIAIVLAGGIGSRVGSNVPKQFIEVLGKPMMIYTLESFEKDSLIDEVVFVCVETHMDIAKEYCKQYGMTKVKMFVSGGSDFIHSCINGMNALRSKCTSEDIVIVTSADRPFISREEIDDAIYVCQKHGSGIAARKCTLCMFMVKEDRTHSGDYQRDNLLQTATPWAFKYGLLIDALDRFERKELPPCESYPTAIYVAAGNEAYFSMSKPDNIKITEKADIALMEQMLKEREGK